MNLANRVIDDGRNAVTYLELVTAQADSELRKEAVYGSDCSFGTEDRAANYPFLDVRVDRQVREDRSFYVPDLLSDKHYDNDPKAYVAAEDHAGHLRDAERLLCETQDLVGLMRAAIGDECDARAMQSDTALKIIEKKLRKAHSRVNKHDRRHTNLFLAYFDRKAKKDG
ncbi:MAG: hypothetical protein AAFY56_01280 [Pseudomonadota bacterium]